MTPDKMQFPRSQPARETAPPQEGREPGETGTLIARIEQAIKGHEFHAKIDRENAADWAKRPDQDSQLKSVMIRGRADDHDKEGALLRDALAALLKMRNQCEWTQYADKWQASCCESGAIALVGKTSPSSFDWQFCPYCGRNIREVA